MTYEVRAVPTIDALHKKCDAIRAHVASVTRQEIIRMVLFFKADARDNIWFLYTSSVRLESRGNAVPKPLNIEGPTPAPKEVVSLPSIRKDNNARAEQEWQRCPCCAQLILESHEHKITVKHAVEVFHLMTQSKEYLDTGQLPLDKFGCQMSANMFDMRRAMAQQTGTLFAEPAK